MDARSIAQSYLQYSNTQTMQPSQSQPFASDSNSQSDSAEKLALFVQYSNDLIATISPDLSLIEISANCQRLLGHNVNALIGSSWPSLLHKDDTARSIKELAELEGHDQRLLSWRIRHLLGYYLWIEAAVVHLANGNLVLFIRNVNEQREMDERLKMERDRVQVLDDGTSHLISRHSIDGRFLFASPASRHLLGIDDDDLIGTQLSNLVHPEDVALVQQQIDTLRSSEGIETITYRVRHHQGYFVWLESQLRLMTAGQEDNVIIVSRDITPLKQAQMQMRQQTRQLVALEEMGAAVTATLELDEVLALVSECLSNIISAESFCILTKTNAEWETAAASGLAADSYLGLHYNHDDVMQLIGTNKTSVIATAINQMTLPNALNSEPDSHTWCSLLVKPLYVGKRLLGVIIGKHRAPDFFTENDVDLLEMASSWAAIAIENGRIVGDLRRRSVQLHAQNKMGRVVTASLELDTVLEAVIAALQQVISAENMAVLLPRGDQWEVVATTGSSAGLDAGDRYRSSAFRRVVFDRETIIVSTETSGNEMPRSVNSKVAVVGWQSMIIGPLEVGDRLVGLIAGVHQRSDAFESADIEQMKLSSPWAAIAINNANLYKRLRRRGKQLQKLTNKVIEVQEMERARLSRELHDESGQSLTALRINLGFLRDRVAEISAEIAAEFDDALDLTQQTMQRLSRLARATHPIALERAGLNEAIGGLCRDFQRHTQIAVTYTSVPFKLTNSASITIYRFVQECLTNAGKYANASEISVTASVTDDHLNICVADDGVGMRSTDPDELSGGISLGLIGMRERLNLIDGTLTIQSQLMQGTALTASIPLARNQD